MEIASLEQGPCGAGEQKPWNWWKSWERFWTQRARDPNELGASWGHALRGERPLWTSGHMCLACTRSLFLEDWGPMCSICDSAPSPPNLLGKSSVSLVKGTEPKGD